MIGCRAAPECFCRVGRLKPDVTPEAAQRRTGRVGTAAGRGPSGNQSREEFRPGELPRPGARPDAAGHSHARRGGGGGVADLLRQSGQSSSRPWRDATARTGRACRARGRPWPPRAGVHGGDVLLSLLGGAFGLVAGGGRAAGSSRAGHGRTSRSSAKRRGRGGARVHGRHVNRDGRRVWDLCRRCGSRGVDATESLRAGARTTGGPQIRAWQRGLLVGQIAVVLVLLASAGLLLESFRRLIGQDLGYTPQSVVAIDLSTTGFQTNEESPGCIVRCTPGWQRCRASRPSARFRPRR